MIVFEALKKELEGKTTFAQIKNTVRDSLEPYFLETTQNSPVIIPVILNKHSDQA